MAEEAITSDNLRDFNNQDIDSYNANNVPMDFYCSEIQNRMEFAEPIPTNPTTTLVQGETQNEANRSYDPPLPYLSSLDDIFPLQQNSQDTTIDDNWGKIDSVATSRQLEHVVHLYKLKENKEPSVTNYTNASNNNSPIVWMVTDNITQQIQDQNEIKDDPIRTEVPVPEKKPKKWTVVTDIVKQIQDQTLANNKVPSINEEKWMATPKVRTRKKAIKLSRTVSTQTRSMKPWNMATQTERIKHIIIRPQGNHPHSQPMTNKSQFNKLKSIVAMLETMERREETTL